MDHLVLRLDVLLIFIVEERLSIEIYDQKVPCLALRDARRNVEIYLKLELLWLEVDKLPFEVISCQLLVVFLDDEIHGLLQIVTYPDVARIDVLVDLVLLVAVSIDKLLTL